MPVFRYVGITQEGEPMRGKIVAQDATEAIRVLHTRQVTVVRLREQRSLWKWRPLTRVPRVPPREKVVMTLQLATMLQAGVPLVVCLDMVAAHSESQPVQSLLQDVSQRVKNGAPLATALGAYPRVFSPWYVGMIQVGEAMGKLDVVLRRLAGHLERTQRFRQQLWGALLYPTAVFGLAMLLIGALLIWVIPSFKTLFAQFGGTLPWPTRIVLEFSQALQNHLFELSGLAVVAAGGGRALLATQVGRRWSERILWRLPLARSLIQKIAIVQMARSLSLLLHSNVAMLDGLALTAKATG
ncbi:MAG: type II secretion system F family protein, partial [Nitrospirae bacterium]